MKYHEFIYGENAQTLFSKFPKFRSGAMNAMRFAMPSYVDLCGIKSVPDLIRLPYGSCWFEGIGPPSSESDNNRWGFLAIVGEEGFQCFLNFYHPNQGHYADWLPGMSFSYSTETKTWKAVSDMQPLLDTPNGPLSMFDNNKSGAELYMKSATHHLEAFLSLLNCSNIHRIEHPAPEQLNKKRAKNGKPPLFSYWTLDLSSNREKGSANGGTHASPRLHLRRGHFRKYAEGKTCWVVPCTVGNKKLGIVHKDYEMRDAEKRVH